ncbi:MAG TPA: L-threonylcarbamoyladenylate synthase [Vicinamibacteria bacterium]|nr:L-threonylcarbamoyladenylate synthase [Vicinamibacteria bacterium]
MATDVVRVSGTEPDPAVVAMAVELLSAGSLLIYPTDTLYALGGRVLDAAAGLAVRRAKGREEGKPLPVVAADLAQARDLCRAWPEVADRLAARFWPGPLTLVVPAVPSVPAHVTAGTGHVAVRVPGLELTRALCRRAGPLVSTSANRAGGSPPMTCADALEAVGAAAAIALDGGHGRAGASTIVDLTSTPPRLLRAGLVPWEEIEGVLRPGER